MDDDHTKMIRQVQTVIEAFVEDLDCPVLKAQFLEPLSPKAKPIAAAAWERARIKRDLAARGLYLEEYSA